MLAGDHITNIYLLFFHSINSYLPYIIFLVFQGKLGELLLSLCYEPNVGRLTVIVIKAKDLKAKDITGASGI